MSVVCILTPVVVAAWPAFSAAVTAAAVSLGYQVASAASQKQAQAAEAPEKRVELEMSRSEIVTGTLERDHRLRVTRSGVTVSFSRDARGQASLCVTGEGYSEDVLRALGEELAGRVVQQYVYQRLMEEMRARQFVVVEEEVEENHAIRLKVRHWEN